MRIGQSQRFDQARPFVALGVALAAWLVAPVAIKAFARASFFEMTAPITATASYASDLQRFWALRLHSKEELIEAGRDLARLDASYSLAVQQNGELQAEVERLQALLHMPPPEHFRFEHARVAQRDFSGLVAADGDPQGQGLRHSQRARPSSTAAASWGGWPRSTPTPRSSS